MLYPRGSAGEPPSPPTALRPSLESSTCAKRSPAPSPAPSPPVHSRSEATRLWHSDGSSLTPGGRGRGKKEPGVPHTARRVLSQALGVDLGPELAIPKSWARPRTAPPATPVSRPPHARPRALPCPTPQNPPVPGAPLTAHARPRRRARERGEPCGCRMPSGRARRGGRRWTFAGREEPRRTGWWRRWRASLPTAAATRPEPKESLAEQGVVPRGRRGRVPALPRPAPGTRPFPRESAPHRRGTERVLMQMLSCLQRVPRRVASLEEKEPEDRYYPQGLQSHTSEFRGRCFLSVPQICLKRLRASAATHIRPQPLWGAGSLSEEHLF